MAREARVIIDPCSSRLKLPHRPFLLCLCTWTSVWSLQWFGRSLGGLCCISQKNVQCYWLLRNSTEFYKIYQCLLTKWTRPSMYNIINVYKESTSSATVSVFAKAKCSEKVSTAQNLRLLPNAAENSSWTKLWNDVVSTICYPLEIQHSYTNNYHL